MAPSPTPGRIPAGRPGHPLTHFAPHRPDVSDRGHEVPMRAMIGDETQLSAAGWLPGSRRGWWIDPATGHELPEWRAAGIARRDAAPSPTAPVTPPPTGGACS
jgi:hypothetical protein